MKIEYIRSDRKTLAVEVTRDLRVLVRMPKNYSLERAEKFVREHKAWIEKSILRQAGRKKKSDLSDQEIKALRNKAREIIPKRVEYFSRLTGLVPTGLRITSAKTRYGSCSGKNSLNFSLYLMLYSAGAIDYVVLHELCHIKHKNHGRDFYGLIARYMPDYKEYVKELRK